MEITNFNNKTMPDTYYDEIGRTCSTHGKEKNTGVLWQNLKGGNTG